MPDTTNAARTDYKFVQGLGLLDSIMIVAGSMIGSGIFIVSADISRQVGSAGWLLVVLLFYKTQTTWPGLLIVLAGVPVYFLWRPRGAG